MDTVHIIYESNYNKKFLLGLLNSKLINCIHGSIVPEYGKAFAEVKIINLKKIPIPTIDFSNHSEKNFHDDIVALVDIMLELNKKKHTAKGEEKEQIQRQIDKTDGEIDAIVYSLYGITEAEKKLIEQTA
jgi:hypothetical protein